MEGFAKFLVKSPATLRSFDKKKATSNFLLKFGKLQDVSCAEETLESCSGKEVVDKGCVSKPLKRILRKKKIYLIAKAKSNMEPNSPAEKISPKKRNITETMIGKLKNFFGSTLSKFRSITRVYAEICVSILAINFKS